MGSKTIDLEIALLHKTIKTPQQYFHTESLLTAMAKPLPAPRTRDGGRTGWRAGSPDSPDRKKRGDRRQADLGRAEQLQRSPTPGALPLGALTARSWSAHEGRGGAAGSGLRVAAPDPARTAGSRATPGCRARDGREGARPGHKGREATGRGWRALRPERGCLAL